ncbi:MAG: helix-turn-helix domain-containing protein [Dehalococcoidales bacterium]
MPILDDYLSVVEAAQVLGVHPGTVKRLCRESRLVAKKIHNTWLIRSDTLHSFARGYKGRRGRPSSKAFPVDNAVDRR